VRISKHRKRIKRRGIRLATEEVLQPVAKQGMRGCPPFQKSEALRNFSSIDITASTALDFPKDRQRIAIKQYLGSVIRSKKRTFLVLGSEL
jgi:hypothetical protein